MIEEIRQRARSNELGRNLMNVCNQAILDRRALLDHIDNLEEGLEAVRELHPRGEFEDSPGDYYCTHCQTTAGIWPCPTIRALEG